MAIAQDLRSALARYDAAGALTRIDAPISAEFETSAVLWSLSSGNTALFDQVSGYTIRVVGNVLNHRAKLAIACGVPLHALQQYATEAYREPRPVVHVRGAPCQEIVNSNRVDLGRDLPIPRISEFDLGRFITAGILIARDPESRRLNLAISRLQLKGPNRLGCYLAQRDGDTARYLDAHRRAGRRMEVAVAIGNHPVVLAASQMPGPDDELSFAGGLFGAGVEMTHCVSVDLEVPAHAEIVLEGSIDPAAREPEGPFGEFTGGYFATEASPVIEVHAVTMRRDALFQMIVGGTHPEHSVTGAIAREVRLLEAVRRAGPRASAVAFPVGGTCRFQAVIALRDAHPGDAATAAMAGLNFSKMLRQVIVVDDDIDVFDRDQVDWAFASRFDPSRDIVMINDCAAHPHDPVAADGRVTKVGFDATMGRREAPGLEYRLPAVPSAVLTGVVQRLGLANEQKQSAQQSRSKE